MSPTIRAFTLKGFDTKLLRTSHVPNCVKRHDQQHSIDQSQPHTSKARNCVKRHD